MIEVVSPEWLQVWLKDKDTSKLIAVSNISKRTLGFINYNKSDGVIFSISDIRNHPKIHRLYQKLLKKQKSNPISPMLQDWISYAISQNR